MKKLIVLMLSVLLTFSVGACKRGEGGNKDDVYVTIIERGFGTEWMEAVAEKYTRQTGIKVHVYGDPNLFESLTQKMNINSNLDDLYYTWNAEWLTWAIQEKMEDLSRVISGSGSGASPLSRMRSEQLKQLGTYDDSLYCAPLLYAPAGFVYNQDYLNDIPSFGEYTKGEFPTTWQGLLDLCTAVNDSSLMKGGSKVKPFSFGGNVDDFYYIFRAMWGQHDDAGFNAYWQYNNVSAPSSEIWKNPKIAEVLDMVYDLMNPKTDGNGIGYADNCVSGVTGMSNIVAQQSFLNGFSVFCITGSWFETEMSGSIDSNTFEYRFAPVPKLGGSEQASTFFNPSGEYFFVPSKAENKEGAKAFLEYIYKEESLIEIHNILQTPTIFDLDESKLVLTDWGQDCFDAVENSKNVVAFAPTEVFFSGALSAFFKHDTDMFSNIAKNKYARGTFVAALNSNYNTTVERWQDYVGKLL